MPIAYSDLKNSNLCIAGKGFVLFVVHWSVVRGCGWVWVQSCGKVTSYMRLVTEFL